MTATAETSIPLDGPIHLTADDAATLHAPRGAALFVVRGQVWLTQDGEQADIVVAAGQRYDLPPGAQIVVGSLRGDADAFALPALDGAENDLHDALRLRAVRLRRAAADRFWLGALHLVRRRVRDLRGAWAKIRLAAAAPHAHRPATPHAQ